MTQETIAITVRFVHTKGGEFDVELPLFYSGTQILDEFIKEANSLGIPSTDDQGNLLQFELAIKGRNQIPLENTLMEAGVKDGDILYFTPKFVAG